LSILEDALLETAKLNPEKITHPFQLAAAWFVMLILLDTILLTAAGRIEKPTWAAGFLVVSSVALSVLVMLAVFLLQTVFRGHLLSDTIFTRWEKERHQYWLKDERKFEGGGIGFEERLEIKETNKIEIPGAAKEQVEASDLHLFRRLSIQMVEIARLPDADRVLAELRKIGIKADVYDALPHQREYLEKSSHQAIWIGKRVPADVAALAVRTAVSIWPHLTYVHISGDLGDKPPDFVHDQLFFGGATKTATDYGLARWSKRDLDKISKDVTLEQFHQLVRTKYPEEEQAAEQSSVPKEKATNISVDGLY
jgi:hypothetical protein